MKLVCELTKLIRHFFPDLLPMLKKLKDPRHASYITYPAHLLLMTRILSSIFYISSMRKSSEEFNSDVVIENIWVICGEEPTVDELPYWETVNRYLAKLDPQGLQDIVSKLCGRLIRSRAFEDARIRGKHWQVIIDGTQLHSSRGELDGKCLYRIHNRGTEKEYRENYYYVLEAKLVLHPDIIVSIMTEFVENTDGEAEKQDCERKACWRLMERLKKSFPQLRICLGADSLYACERFFRECKEKGWHYILRFKEKSIPTIAAEYHSLKKMEKNLQEGALPNGTCWWDYVSDIDYEGHKVNVVEYQENEEVKIQKGKKKGETRDEQRAYMFLTSLPLQKKNVRDVVERGRMRWMIENEGFNEQKRQGYNLEHQYSRNYQAMKCHYYLIQIGHMIAQLMEAWERLWKNVSQSQEQKHRRILESMKAVRLKDCLEELAERIQVRLT